MKKIIGAVALASLVVGFASADAKFALNYRTQMVGFSRLINAPNDNADENQNYWFKQSSGWQSATDTVSVTATGDFGGVTVRIDPDAAKETLTINQYNGYIKLGSFELGGGAWKDGKYLTQYQIKNDSDAGWYQGDLYGVVKLGSIYANAITQNVDDMVNFAGGGDGTNSGYLTWQGDVGDVEITATGTFIGINGTWDEEETIYTGFGAQVNAKTDNFQAEFVFKTASNKESSSGLGEQRAFGLYVMPVIDGLTLNVGGALGFNNGNVTELNADLRARKVFGGTSVTFYTNVSHITNKNDYVTDFKAHLGAEYLSSSGSLMSKAAGSGLVNDFGGSSDQTYNTHMWNMLGVRSKLTDNFYFLFTAGDITSLRNVGTDHWSGSELFVAPGFQLMNGKSGIATYFRFGMSHVGVKDYDDISGDGANLSLLVPVVIRVRF